MIHYLSPAPVFGEYSILMAFKRSCALV